MKDKNNDPICTSYEYSITNNKSIDKSKCNIFLIVNKEMALNLSNNNIQQFFGDTTYH